MCGSGLRRIEIPSYCHIRTNALGEATVYAYNLQGRKTYEGGGTHPVRFTYDDEGRMTGMITYRDESGPDDTTVWTYDSATGLPKWTLPVRKQGGGFFHE